MTNAQVQTFSGGMKRRLSLIISSLGDPKILFLDEPTTGMDPKSRREVWKIIQDMKSRMSILLTTHAMEEADVLSDRIMVVNRGEMKCVGRSLELKNSYGDGYRLSLIVELQNQMAIQKFIKLHIPSAKLLSKAASSLMFTIPLLSI